MNLRNKPPDRLRKRAEFLAVQKGEKRRGRYFLLEIRKQPQALSVQGLPDSDLRPARIGYTVSRKNGNAVSRNRIRRRLREAVRLHVSALLENGTDYVIVARPELRQMPFQLLVEELKRHLCTRYLRTKAKLETKYQKNHGKNCEKIKSAKGSGMQREQLQQNNRIILESDTH